MLHRSDTLVRMSGGRPKLYDGVSFARPETVCKLDALLEKGDKSKMPDFLKQITADSQEANGNFYNLGLNLYWKNVRFKAKIHDGAEVEVVLLAAHLCDTTRLFDESLRGLEMLSEMTYEVTGPDPDNFTNEEITQAFSRVVICAAAQDHDPDPPMADQANRVPELFKSYVRKAQSTWLKQKLNDVRETVSNFDLVTDFKDRVAPPLDPAVGRVRVDPRLAVPMSSAVAGLLSQLVPVATRRGKPHIYILDKCRFRVWYLRTDGEVQEYETIEADAVLDALLVVTDGEKLWERTPERKRALEAVLEGSQLQASKQRRCDTQRQRVMTHVLAAKEHAPPPIADFPVKHFVLPSHENGSGSFPGGRESDSWKACVDGRMSRLTCGPTQLYSGGRWFGRGYGAPLNHLVGVLAPPGGVAATAQKVFHQLHEMKELALLAPQHESVGAKFHALLQCFGTCHGKVFRLSTSLRATLANPTDHDIFVSGSRSSHATFHGALLGTEGVLLGRKQAKGFGRDGAWEGSAQRQGFVLLG